MSAASADPAHTRLRPRGRDRYPGSTAYADPADITDTATQGEFVERPRAAASAVSRASGQQGTGAAVHQAAAVHAAVGAETAGGERAGAKRSSGRRASVAPDPAAAAAERLAADRATVAAQGEALRRAAQRRRDSDPVRPRASVEDGDVQVVSPKSDRAQASRHSEAPERRLIAGGVFDAVRGASVAPPSVVEPSTAQPSVVAPPVAPPSVVAPSIDSPSADVATRAIAVVRQAGPGPSGIDTTTPFVPRRTLVMGILNVTLDSFSDGGRYARFDDAIAHARTLAADGADIIDIGGESTRPGAPRVEVHEEQRRVIPVIRELVGLGMRVSIDTMNAATAFSAIEAGADIVNDVSGGLADKNMAQVVSDTDRTYIAMHWRGHSDVMQQHARYSNAVDEVKAELFQRVAELVVQGVNPDRIVIDPGLGFAKLAEHNWQLLGHFDELAELGLPVLVAASRKRFLGGLLPEEAGVHERDPATAVISALAAQSGAWAVRVHDVASTRASLDVWEAWQRGSRG